VHQGDAQAASKRARLEGKSAAAAKLDMQGSAPTAQHTEHANTFATRQVWTRNKLRDFARFRPMNDAGSTSPSLELELELTGQETDEELETAIRAKLAEILGVFGRTAAENAWGQAPSGSEPTAGKAEFVGVMQQDYIASTSAEDQESLLQGILVQAKQHRDAIRGGKP
jgi:hypothetical protein